jgi:opacity protein-like surface antigen
MKKVVVTAVAAVIGGIGTVAQAADTASEQGFYLGGVYSIVSYKEDNLETLEPKAIALQAGWNFNKYAALEGRIGFGAGSDSFQVPGLILHGPVKVEIKVDSYYSGLLRGTLPINDSFDVYGLAGFSSVKFKASSSRITTSGDSSFSFGAGGEVNLGGHSGLAIEWSRLLSGDGYDADALSVGYRYRF